VLPAATENLEVGRVIACAQDHVQEQVTNNPRKILSISTLS
jgi:hypothetical protein